MKILLSCVLLSLAVQVNAQLPLWYQCVKTETAPGIDGDLSDPSWQGAPWSEAFIDIRDDSFPAPDYETRFKMLWDDEFLYVGVLMEEPHVRGRLRQRDTVIFWDNDIELFIDPDNDHHNYGELEVNALNTHWDLLLPKPYSNGGKADNSWDIEGLQKAVGIYGTINDATDIDSAWVTEWAIPMDVLSDLCPDGCGLQAGDHMKVNFSRVQWPLRINAQKGSYIIDVKSRGEVNWTWSPQGAIAMHKPDKWGVVILKESLQNLEEMPPSIEEQERCRMWLMNAYHETRAFKKKNGVLPSLNQLANSILTPSSEIRQTITEEADGSWKITCTSPGRYVASIASDGLFTFERT